jgi:S-DNA-T family DNA segregation ATPase FtsK/SpoIIIE
VPRTVPRTSVRRPWTASAVQGWRQEIAVTIFCFIVLAIATSVASWCPYAIAAVAAVLIWRRPNIRVRFQREAQLRSTSRRLHAAMWNCSILGRDGNIPQVKKNIQTPVGRRFLLRLPPGLHFELIEARAPEIASALGARQILVKAVRENAKYVELTQVNVSAFPKILRTELVSVPHTDLWQRFPLGLSDDGFPVLIELPEHNLLIGGEPGSGKSVALSTIIGVAALDPRVSLTLLDGKQVELAAWKDVADHFVGPDQVDAVRVLEQLRTLMDHRYEQLLADRRRKIEPDGSFGLHVVVIDELAFYLRGGKKAERDEFAELLRDLVSRGRAAGIIVVAATQKPSHEVVPTFIRDLFSFRLAMRCSSVDASDTILGSGWAAQGFSAATIEPSQRGVGLLLAEGGVPILLKLPFLSDNDIDTIALRAAQLRGSR